jgi:hypothetical protein
VYNAKINVLAENEEEAKSKVKEEITKNNGFGFKKFTLRIKSINAL